jgi:hypothetical protein
MPRKSSATFQADAFAKDVVTLKPVNLAAKLALDLDDL